MTAIIIRVHYLLDDLFRSLCALRLNRHDKCGYLRKIYIFAMFCFWKKNILSFGIRTMWNFNVIAQWLDSHPWCMFISMYLSISLYHYIGIFYQMLVSTKYESNFNEIKLIASSNKYFIYKMVNRKGYCFICFISAIEYNYVFLFFNKLIDRKF